MCDSCSLILSLCVSADINECSSLTKPCGSGFNCINTVGSYTCQQKVIKCNQGYQASPDGTKCVGKIYLLNTHITYTLHVQYSKYECILYINYQFTCTAKKILSSSWRYFHIVSKQYSMPSDVDAFRKCMS